MEAIVYNMGIARNVMLEYVALAAITRTTTLMPYRYIVSQVNAFDPNGCTVFKMSRLLFTW